MFIKLIAEKAPLVAEGLGMIRSLSDNVRK